MQIKININNNKKNELTLSSHVFVDEFWKWKWVEGVCFLA